jgi:peptidoglycan/LPS O-acetylase OafA/YrhL
LKKDTDNTNRVYFPNLDGLRFIGSIIIIIFHIESLKGKHFQPQIPAIKYYLPIGNFDVSLFFVLSGFLITYLLLKEKKEKGTIDLKSYYVRRTMRIWPLYYLVVFLGFFILPLLDTYSGHTYSARIHEHFWLYFFECIFFLSTLTKFSKGLPQTIGPIWSVAVEELFYLCWPLFLKKTKSYVLLFFVITIIVVLIRNGFLLGIDIFSWSDARKSLAGSFKAFIIDYRVSCMAIGAIGAYWVVFEKNKILKLLYRRDFQLAVYLITIAMLLLKFNISYVSGVNFPDFSYELYSVFFMIIIVNLATNPHTIINLDYGWMNYLGKVSYGLYMYHPIMRILALELTEYIFKGKAWNWQMDVILYSVTIFSTIIIAILSYEFFEKRFLKKAKRVTTLR